VVVSGCFGTTYPPLPPLESCQPAAELSYEPCGKLPPEQGRACLDEVHRRNLAEIDRQSACERGILTERIRRLDEESRDDQARQRRSEALSNAFSTPGPMGSQPSTPAPQPSYRSTQQDKARECYNDYACGYGQRCLKANYSASGTCVQVVNKYGTPQATTPPRRDSYKVKTPSASDCKHDGHCPGGFRCDLQSGACLRR